MAVVINGTTGITSVNGSASAPSVTGTDTDTGIVYGTNTLSLATGGTTAVTVNSSQNVGIGTSSPSYPVDVYSAAAGIVRVKGGSSSGQGGAFFVGAATSGSTLSAFGDWARINGGTVDQATAVYSVSSAPMLFAVGSERMRIDTSGNVGIGNTSSGSRLYVASATNSTAGQIGATIHARDTTATTGVAGFAGYMASSGPGLDWVWGKYTSSAGASLFQIKDAAAAVGTAFVSINTNGSLLVGTTSYSPGVGSAGFTSVKTDSGWFAAGFSGYYGVGINAIAATGALMYFYYNGNGSPIGSISTNGSSTTYATSSDYRLKENVQPMTGALAKVAAMKPCTYTWKATGTADEGFIAHELQEVCPSAVTGEKDGVEIYVDEDGNEQTRPKYQGIDTSFLVATLTAAIQEQQAIIEQLRADVAQLKGQA